MHIISFQKYINAFDYIYLLLLFFGLLLITFFWDRLFYLLNVSFTTTDIDECEEDKKFTDKQICVNKPGSYACLCVIGYHKERAECVPHQSSLAIHLAVGEYIIFSIYCMYIAPAGPLLLAYK